MYEEEMYLELKKAYGADAEFREGQMDAVESILVGKRTLVVQKTGWGRLVMQGKYKTNSFSEELVEASYKLLKDFVVENDIKWVTNIPSVKRPELVKNFAIKLSEKLLLAYIDAIEKIQDARCQKELNTSYL